jgi:hypothetical protein
MLLVVVVGNHSRRIRFARAIYCRRHQSSSGRYRHLPRRCGGGAQDLGHCALALGDACAGRAIRKRLDRSGQRAEAQYSRAQYCRDHLRRAKWLRWISRTSLLLLQLLRVSLLKRSHWSLVLLVVSVGFVAGIVFLIVTARIFVPSVAAIQAFVNPIGLLWLIGVGVVMLSRALTAKEG